MKLKIYQLDAFTDKLFGGNPAAVCPLSEWLPDELLQNIALENNLAETAFYVKEENNYRIRWFTPTIEVELCGHATLAAAYVLFHCENYSGNVIEFQSRSGILKVYRENDFMTLNFPKDLMEEVKITDQLQNCFDKLPVKVFKGLTDYMFVFDTESEILQMNPNLTKIADLDARGVIITAKGDEVDFVSRFFAPQSGIDEDPVTRLLYHQTNGARVHVLLTQNKKQ